MGFEESLSEHGLGNGLPIGAVLIAVARPILVDRVVVLHLCRVDGLTEHSAS